MTSAIGSLRTWATIPKPTWLGPACAHTESPFFYVKNLLDNSYFSLMIDRVRSRRSLQHERGEAN